MKKITLLLFFVLFSVFGFGQFTEDFESGLTIPDGWTVINGGDDNAWEILDLSDYGYTAHSGNNAAVIFYDSDVPHDDYLITPPITVTAGVNDMFSFWARSLNPEYPEQIDVKISTTGINAEDFTIDLDTNVAPTNGENYYNYSYDLSDYLGQTIYIAFYSTTVDKEVFEIDDVVSGALPACLSPNGFSATGITSDGATLSWSSTGNSFQIEYGPAGFTPGSGTIVNAEVSPYILELDPSTEYDAYLVRDCGSENLSDAMVVSFTTLALPPDNDTCIAAIPLTVGNSFESAAFEGTSTGATTDSEVEPDCISSYANDVWFTVVVPEDGNLILETRQVSGSDNDDTVIEVFSGTCGELLSIECNDDNEDDDAEGYFSKLSLTDLPPGETLYVAVWQYYFDWFGDPLMTGAFMISAYNENLSVKGNDMPGLKYYPNPVRDIMHLSYKENIDDINVYNLLGQKVYSQNINSANAQVNLSTLPTGTYTVKLTSGKNAKTIKMLKQ